MKAKGIPVASEHFWAHMTRIEPSLPAARGFGKAGRGAAVDEAVDKQAVIAEAISSVVIIAAVAALAVALVRKAAD